jgi:hypothetical protein
VVELRAFARSIGVPTSGNKADLTDRISRALSGQAPPMRKSPSPKRTLPEPLGADTELVGNVVLSRQLRQWFIDQVGPGFRANQALREFLADGQGRTLGDALAMYTATVGQTGQPIAGQFLYNRFVRDWYRDHPGGSPIEMRQAWAVQRNLPLGDLPLGDEPAR